MKPTIAGILMLATAHLAVGQITGVDLSQYHVAASYSLPNSASEASAVAYNWDNGNLYVMGDEGQAIVEVTPGGQVVSTMSMTGFQDTEGLTYIGGGKFLVAEERIQDAFLLSYTAGGTVNRSTLTDFDFGPTVGNIGLEGITYDPVRNQFWGVKETSPQAIYQATLDLNTGAASVTTNPFSPGSLGVIDLSDIQSLATVPSLVGTAYQDNFLIFSQESRKLLEVNRSGQVLSSFDFSAYSTEAEGVTIDPAGNIYIADESPHLTVLSPNTAAVPEPGTLALVGVALLGIAAVRSRFGKPALRIGGAALAIGLLAPQISSASIYITEYMYDANDSGEFIELTNVGTTAVDMTGWSYDDDSRTPGVFDLSGFGVVQPGESVVLAQDSAATFRSIWGLGSDVKVLGGYTNNLGRADEINIFDSTGQLADRLTYGDQVFSGTIRTQGVSGDPGSLAALGQNDISQWVYSQPGDLFGSYPSTTDVLANPGRYAPAAVPEPSALWLVMGGAVAVLLPWRRLVGTR